MSTREEQKKSRRSVKEKSNAAIGYPFTNRRKRRRRRQDKKTREEEYNTQQSKLAYPWHEHIRRESLVASSYQ